MKKRIAFIGAMLSVIPLGQPLIFKTGFVLSTTGLMLSVSQKVKADSVDFYFDRGLERGNSGDYYGAIADFTKVIEINPYEPKAFYNRGWNKGKLKDYNGEISDYTKAIEINPKYVKAYYNRGNAKSDMKDYYGAIADFTKAIEINPQYLDAYVNRSIAKENIGDINGACSDAKRAVYLGDNDPENTEWIYENC